MELEQHDRQLLCKEGVFRQVEKGYEIQLTFRSRLLDGQNCRPQLTLLLENLENLEKLSADIVYNENVTSKIIVDQITFAEDLKYFQTINVSVSFEHGFQISYSQPFAKKGFN